jgi:hypothetical protein
VTEDALQISVVQYLTLARPKCEFFHVPNQGRFPVQYRRKLARMGVKAGVADLLFILPGGRIGCIELKTDKGRQSPSQKDFERRMGELGTPYRVAHSIEEVCQSLREWGCL